MKDFIGFCLDVICVLGFQLVLTAPRCISVCLCMFNCSVCYVLLPSGAMNDDGWRYYNVNND